MIRTYRKRKRANVPEHTRKETVCVSTHDDRRKEDIDGIYLYDDFITVIEGKTLTKRISR
jgi:hypothetical protein